MGYLTSVHTKDIAGKIPDGMIALMLPNEEIRERFETTIIKWFDDYDEILCYGIVFFKKCCVVKKKCLYGRAEIHFLEGFCSFCGYSVNQVWMGKRVYFARGFLFKHSKTGEE